MLKSCMRPFRSSKPIKQKIQDIWMERKERKAYYQSFDQAKLLAMTEDEFLEYISKLWSMVIWGNKK